MNDEEFSRLATLYLEDAIDDNDLELLNRELATSPGRVRQFNDLRLLTGLINEHGRTVETAADGDLKSKRPAAPPAPVSVRADSNVYKPSPRHWSPKAKAISLTALAAAGTIFLFLVWPAPEPRSGTTVPAIATLQYTSHAKWQKGERLVGDRFGEGKLNLEVGLARLDFSNGATVTLQGPAEFEILSSDKTILNSGILTASIPESAIGFEVLTPAMDVVDLGTAFGVSVGADGETDVCVFEGEVEVSLADSRDRPQLVREGYAVRSRPKADSIDVVDYSTELYENSWPVTSGVLQATGLMKFVSPGPEFVPGRYEDSSHILVFPERSHVSLESELEVNVSQPGQYRRVRRKVKQPIAAGQVIRSYLLQLNPVGEFTREEAGRTRVIGQITFDRPILGLIGGTAQLIRTDALLGHPLGDYGDTRRGIEPTRPDDQPDSGRDHVTLSRDRRTLSLDLSA
ncbi:MAG: FecR domain-containing protein, partial [Planctomycetota bacterium]|nr:FecR domain-containing protein [Planctomycetota bacterium]